jgi:hypothetical protein
VMFNDKHDVVVLVEFRHGYQQLRELFGRLARQFSRGALVGAHAVWLDDDRVGRQAVARPDAGESPAP